MRISAVALAAVVLGAACVSPVPPPEVRPSGTPTPGVLDGVAVYPLGNIHGDVALVARAKPQWATGGLGLGEIWTVPLDGSAPRLLVRYPGAYAEAGGQGLLVLRRQLSADAGRLALTVALPVVQPSTFSPQVALIDLTTTDAHVVRPSPDRTYSMLRPALSPGGDRIAFDMYESSFWTGVGTMRSDGADLRELCRAGIRADARSMASFYGCGGVLGWAPDGRVAFAEVDGYSLVDAGGAVERIGYRLSSMLAVDWRKTEPSLVAASSLGLTTSDQPGASRRVLVGPGAFPQQFEPRWRPGHDDVLVRDGPWPSSKLVLRTSSTAVELAAGRCPARGEWSPDGSKIVYIADCVRDPFEIRVIDAGAELSARSPDRLLAELPDGRDGWRAIDLVVVRYP